ncbi:AEC family transporter [Rhodobacteraceae bacterium NNCM2]|nr:AEC family transporter [Coraliihabitans acroporae]
MLLQIIDITAPVFLLGLIGFVWARSGTEFELQFVSRMVLNFALPCLMFSTLVQADITPDAMAEIALASFAAYLFAGGGMWLMLRLIGFEPRIWWAASVFGNTGNIGLPLCLFAFGEKGLALAMVFFAVGASLQFTLGLWSMAGMGQWRAVLRQPIVYAAVLGCAVSATGWQPPTVIMRTLSLAGQIAIPIMLITLGYSIARLRLGETGRAAFIAVLRLVVLGGAAVLVARVMGLGSLPAAVMLLQFLTPGAVTVYMMATRYDGEPETIAGLVLISTVLTLAVIPAALSLLI